MVFHLDYICELSVISKQIHPDSSRRLNECAIGAADLEAFGRIAVLELRVEASSHEGYVQPWYTSQYRHRWGYIYILHSVWINVYIYIHIYPYTI